MIYKVKVKAARQKHKFPAAPARGRSGAEGTRRWFQVGQKVQRVQHKQPLDQVKVIIVSISWHYHALGQYVDILIYSSLPAIQRLVDERTLDMEIIVNPKVINYTLGVSHNKICYAPVLHDRLGIVAWSYFKLPILQSLDGGLNVYQLETAVGAAMKCFDSAIGINVPRSRLMIDDEGWRCCSWWWWCR